MKKIYCIASGEYSDWQINYAFENKEKRDNLLDFLTKNNDYYEYHEYDINLCDDDISVIEPVNYYLCKVWGIESVNVYVMNTAERKRKNKINISIFSGELSYYEFEISKEEYENKKRYTNKFKKIFQDKAAEVNYMLLEGMTINEVEKILNGE